VTEHTKSKESLTNGQGIGIMAISKYIKSLAAIAGLMFAASSANAAIWNIIGVENGDSEHSPSYLFDNSTPDGEVYAFITGLTEGKKSTYNDETGKIKIWVDIDAVSIPSKAILNGSYKVTGKLKFDEHGVLSKDSNLKVRKGPTAVGDKYVFEEGFHFGSTFYANTFLADLEEGLGLMGLIGVTQDGLRGVEIGLTLQTSAVPVPAAAWLFGSALIGMAGLRRRKK
jgi:hypothetical protein